MPFGSFAAQEREVRSLKTSEKKEAPAPVTPVKRSVVNSTKLNILLVGRSMGLIQEFLCSMNQNMSQAMQQEGLSYYTRELESIADIVSVKKKLEQFFWFFSADYWTYSPDDESEKIYTFSISPSGNQKMALDLVIHCAVPMQKEHLALEQADACWVLADGPLLDGAEYDVFGQYIREFLNGMGTKPVCLILSQIEKWGHFSNTNDIAVFPQEAYQKLIEICKKKLMTPNIENQAVAAIPVQIYGGLEYVDADSNGQPRLHISQSGFFQSYIPESCEIPGLYTILAICSRNETDFFASMPGGGLSRIIRRYFVKKFGNADWKPTFLRDKEEL